MFSGGVLGLSLVVATLYFLISNCPEMGVYLKLQISNDLEWVRNKV